MSKTPDFLESGDPYIVLANMERIMLEAKIPKEERETFYKIATDTDFDHLIFCSVTMLVQIATKPEDKENDC